MCKIFPVDNILTVCYSAAADINGDRIDSRRAPGSAANPARESTTYTLFSRSGGIIARPKTLRSDAGRRDERVHDSR